MRRWASGRTDRRAELALGAVAVITLVLIAALMFTVLQKAWPSFSHNGLHWFASGGDIEEELGAMERNAALAGKSIFYFRAWPVVWGTIVVTLPAVLMALVTSTLAAVFLSEFAPAGFRRVMDPVIRLLAGVPSVIYGLIGILAIAPYIGNHLISQQRRHSVQYVVQLSGANLMTAAVILAIMILPIMVAISTNALDSVPRSWREGSAALGVNRWRTVWRVSLRTARPAIVAATVLATARALGEAIMLAMVAGSRAFSPNPLDGLTFLFEPVRPLAATILQHSEGLATPAVKNTVYAIAAVLLVSAMFLSLIAWVAKQQFKRFGVQS